MIFYYVGDGNFYGIHAENCPVPVFRFKKESGIYIYDQLGDRDTHDYYEEDILYMIPCDESIWDTGRIDGKPLEEVLQDSYIVNISWYWPILNSTYTPEYLSFFYKEDELTEFAEQAGGSW